MAYLAACTNKDVRKQVNEDSCCIEVAQTPLGEVLMAVVCDGVGGLSRGDVASSTVIDRFATWFEHELPLLVEGMLADGRFSFDTVKAIWSTMLQSQNELIRNHGVKLGAKLGTTFTGIICCNGRFLTGHVGDCRAYRMDSYEFEQITEDQTLVAKRLAAGEITEEEAKKLPTNVILQSVGTSRVLKQVFYEGRFTPDDLFVICCDGAFKKAGNDGVRKLFQRLGRRDEAAMNEACNTLLQFDMDSGEKDNLTVVCFSGVLAGPGEEASQPAAPVTLSPAADAEDEAPTIVDLEDTEDDLPTMVDDESDEDDLPTMVEDESDDDLPTMVEGDPDLDDDLPTMVEGSDV